MGVPDSNQSIVFSLDPIFGVNLPTIDLVCLRTTLLRVNSTHFTASQQQTTQQQQTMYPPSSDSLSSAADAEMYAALFGTEPKESLQEYLRQMRNKADETHENSAAALPQTFRGRRVMSAAKDTVNTLAARTMSDVECDPQTDATPSVAIEDELHTAQQLQEVFEKYVFKVQSSKTASLYHAAMREMQIDMNAACIRKMAEEIHQLNAERERHNEEMKAERKRHNEEMERMKAQLERLSMRHSANVTVSTEDLHAALFGTGNDEELQEFLRQMRQEKSATAETDVTATDTAFASSKSSSAGNVRKTSSLASFYSKGTEAEVTASYDRTYM